MKNQFEDKAQIEKITCNKFVDTNEINGKGYYNSDMKNKNSFDEVLTQPENVKEEVFQKVYSGEDFKLHTDELKDKCDSYPPLIEERNSFHNDYNNKISNYIKLYGGSINVNPKTKFQSLDGKETNLKKLNRITRHAEQKSEQNLYGDKFRFYGKVNPFIINNTQSILSNVNTPDLHACAVDTGKMTDANDYDNDDFYGYEDEVTEDSSDSHYEYKDSTEESQCSKDKKMKTVTSSAHILDAKVYKPKSEQKSCPPDDDTPINKLNKHKRKNKLHYKYGNSDKKDLVILQPLERKLDENSVEGFFNENEKFYLSRSPNSVKINHVENPSLKVSEKLLGYKYNDERVLRPVQKYELNSLEDKAVKNKIAAKPYTKNRYNYGLQYGSQHPENGEKIILGTGNGYFKQAENSNLKKKKLNFQIQSLVLDKDLVTKPSGSLKCYNSMHRAKRFSQINPSKTLGYPENVVSLQKYADINLAHKLKTLPIGENSFYSGCNGDNNAILHEMQPFQYAFFNYLKDNRYASDPVNVSLARQINVPDQNSNLNKSDYENCYYERSGNIDSLISTDNKDPKILVNNSDAKRSNNVINGYNNDYYEYFGPRNVQILNGVVPRKRRFSSDENDNYGKVNKNLEACCGDYAEKIHKSTKDKEAVDSINYYDLADDLQNIREADIFYNNGDKDRSDKKYLLKEVINKSNKLSDNSDKEDKTVQKSYQNIYHAENQEAVTNTDEMSLVSNREKMSFYHNKNPEKMAMLDKAEVQKTTASGLTNLPLKKFQYTGSKLKDNGIKHSGKQCHPPSGPPKFRWCSEETDPVSDQEYEDALKGKIALRIVEVILAKVHKSSKMTSDFGFCKAAKKPVNNEINECENQNSILKSQDLKNIMKSMENMSYNGCNRLPYKLKEFLEWLVKVKPVRSVYLKEKTYKRHSQSNCSLRDSAFLFHNYNLLLTGEYQDPKITDIGFNSDLYGVIDDYDNVPKMVPVGINEKKEFNTDSDLKFDGSIEKNYNSLLLEGPKLFHKKSEHYVPNNEKIISDVKVDGIDHNVEVFEDSFPNSYDPDEMPNSYIDNNEIDRDEFKNLYNYPIIHNSLYSPAQKLKTLLKRQETSDENENKKIFPSKACYQQRFTELDPKPFQINEENGFQENLATNNYAAQLRQKRNGNRLQLRELFFEKYPHLKFDF